MTLEEFARGFACLTAAFPSERVTDMTRDVWFELLHPMPYELYSAAVRHVLATHRYHTFPTPAEIVEILETDSKYRVPAGPDGKTAAGKLECYRRAAAQHAQLANKQGELT